MVKQEDLGGKREVQYIKMNMNKYLHPHFFAFIMT